MPRIFVDMDGVLVDFDRYKVENNLTGDQVKSMPGAYAAMEPMPGALAGIRSLIGMGFEVWIATKPPTGVTYAYSDKAGWILRYLPELKRRIIITHDKGLLGSANDYLIDDRPHKANCEQFAGTLIPFHGLGGIDWDGVLAYFRKVRDEPTMAAEDGNAKLPSRFQIGDRVIVEGDAGQVKGVTFAWGRVNYLIVTDTGDTKIAVSQFVHAEPKETEHGNV